MGTVKKKTLSWIEEKSEAAVEKWVRACEYAAMPFHIKDLVELCKTTTFFPISSKKLQNMERHDRCDYTSFSHDPGIKPRYVRNIMLSVIFNL